MTRWGPLLTRAGVRGRNVARAVRSVGVGVRFCERQEEFLAACDEEPDFAVVNAEGDGMADALRTFRSLTGRPFAPRAVLFGDLDEPDAFRDLLEANLLYHVVAASPPGALARLATTISKFFVESPFGVEPYLPWGTRVGSLPLTCSADKDRVLDRLTEFAEAMDIPPRLSGLARSVADEFVMNAIYDAPVDPKGEPIFADTPRSQPVQLPEGHRARFQFASTGGALLVATFDPYGSLRTETLHANLKRTLAGGSEQIRHGTAGAGVGLYLAFRSLSDWIINVVPNKGTEMIGLVRTSGTYRDHVAMPKSIHLFAP